MTGEAQKIARRVGVWGSFFYVADTSSKCYMPSAVQVTVLLLWSISVLLSPCCKGFECGADAGRARDGT